MITGTIGFGCRHGVSDISSPSVWLQPQACHLRQAYPHLEAKPGQQLRWNLQLRVSTVFHSFELPKTRYLHNSYTNASRCVLCVK